MKTDKIYLVGFMAAGKTTLAHALGRRLTWRVEDIDARIEARERRTIASLFAHEGEAYFRRIEREVLHDLIPARSVVVATGGGTFVDAENRAAINRDGLSIWLDAPFDEIVQRLPPDGRRPLASSREQLEALFAFRRQAYQQAHVRVNASAGPPDALVEQVLDSLGW